MSAATTAGATASSSAGPSTSSSSGGGAGGAGGDIGQPSDSYPADHDPPPQVITLGGPLLTHPVIVPVYFADYDATFRMPTLDFLTKVGATSYWKAISSEYGVGAAQAKPPVDLMETAPVMIDDSDIATCLADKLDANDPAWPAPDGDTVYVLLYPATTTITLQTVPSCAAFDGYHSSTTLDAAHGSASVAYAVIPTCGGNAAFDSLDVITSTLSHELIEAATDPYPLVNPAYATADGAHLFWELAGGEVADMCAQFTGSFQKLAELPDYLVQRSWSNKAALEGRDPCQPELPNEIYFAGAPRLPDTIPTVIAGQAVKEKGVRIPVGQSKEIEIDLFSEADTGGPFDVEVLDDSALFGGPKLLDFALDATKGENGQKLHATVTVKAAGKYSAELFDVRATRGKERHTWVGIVGNK